MAPGRLTEITGRPWTQLMSTGCTLVQDLVYIKLPHIGKQLNRIEGESKRYGSRTNYRTAAKYH